MDKKVIGVLTVAGLLLVGGERAYAAAFTVEDWSLGSFILMPNGMVADGQGSTTPQNPFSETHRATWGEFSITTAHDFSWSESTGRFLTETQMAADGLNEPLPTTNLDERLWISTTRPVPLSYSLEFSFNLPTDSMKARMSFGIFDPANSEFLVAETFIQDTLQGTGPGMFSLSGDVLLPANRTWNIVSIMELATSTGSSGVATGTGSIELQLAPEPQAGLLLMLGSLFAMLKRRRPLDVRRRSSAP